MVKFHHIKASFRFFIALCLIILNAIWGILASIFSFLIGCAETEEEDGYSSPIGDNYNYRTGDLDSVKRPDGIYDERKFH